jgi:hypothetical protein
MYNAVRVPRKLGFDTISYVDPDTASLFLMSGYYFCVRYIRRDIHVNDRPDMTDDLVSLSKKELRELVKAGMLVSPVQFAAQHSWRKLGSTYGAEIGAAAATNCQLLDMPKGITVWCDAEWVDGPSESQIWDYLVAWGSMVKAGGYSPGLYVGSGSILDSDKLYGLPYFRHYWKANSIVPMVSERGYQMIQGFQCGYKVSGRPAGPRIHGLVIDQNIVHLDQKGERFRVVGK